MFSKTARTSIHRPGQLLSVFLYSGSAISAAYASSHHIQSRSFPKDLSHLLALLILIHLATKFPCRKHLLPFPKPRSTHPSGTSELHYALSFMQLLPQKWLLLEAAEWQNRINEKEGWSTAIFNFKSTCVHKTYWLKSLSILTGFQVAVVQHHK